MALIIVLQRHAARACVCLRVRTGGSWMRFPKTHTNIHTPLNINRHSSRSHAHKERRSASVVLFASLLSDCVRVYKHTIRFNFIQWIELSVLVRESRPQTSSSCDTTPNARRIRERLARCRRAGHLLVDQEYFVFVGKGRRARDEWRIGVWGIVWAQHCDFMILVHIDSIWVSQWFNHVIGRGLLGFVCVVVSTPFESVLLPYTDQNKQFTSRDT